MVVPAVSGSSALIVDPLSRAVAAHLARYKGQWRAHTAWDLRSYLIWCDQRRLDPLAASRVHVELWVRWMQEIRRLQPATMSRRVSVVARFYRTCVIDAVLPASPAEYLRRLQVPPESPTLGLTHLQFEALLTAARLSPNPNDFALIAMLGLLGLRIFEACGADIADLGEEHGHRVLRVRGKGDKTVLVPLPPAVSRAIEAAGRGSGPIHRRLAITHPARTASRAHRGPGDHQSRSSRSAVPKALRRSNSTSATPTANSVCAHAPNSSAA